MMLSRSTDAPPFISDHFVTGVWDGGQWGLHVGLALLYLAVLGGLIPLVLGWVRDSWDEMAGWVQAVVAIGMTAALVVAMWVFGDQLIAILNHLPATSFRGKFWKVAGVVVVAAVAQSWALWRVWAQLLSGGTESRADVIPIVVGAAIPIVLGAWVVLATIPVVFGFTVFALIVAAVVVAFLMWAND